MPRPLHDRITRDVTMKDLTETHDPCEMSVRTLRQQIAQAQHTAVVLLGAQTSPADARAVALVRTKLEEADLWLGKVKDPTVGFREDLLP